MCIEKSRDGLNQDVPAQRGIFLSKHITQSSPDGYRTPTTQDYEHQIANSAQHVHNQGGKSSGSSHTRLPTLRSGLVGKHQNLSSLNVSHQIVEDLQWRERIRHFTWTFFTMTMATGGIASVIHSGRITELRRQNMVANGSRQSHFVSKALRPLASSSFSLICFYSYSM